MDWARIVASVTGTVDQELLAWKEYLAAGNRILKAQLNGRPKLSDAELGALGEIGHRLGRKVLADIATVARPDTILGWYRKLVARKCDGSMARQYPGRPRIKREVEEECLSKVLLFSERSLRRALSEYLDHFHARGIITGRLTSCCFLGTRIATSRGLCSVANGWVGFCAIITERRRDGGVVGPVFDLTALRHCLGRP